MFFQSDDQPPFQQPLIFPRKKSPYITQLSSLQKIRQIASGSFGYVYQYYYPLKNQLYAIKKMKFNGRKDYNTIRQIQKQIKLLYQTDSPYLIKLLDHYQEQNTTGYSYVYLITQYIDGKNLYDAILKPKNQQSYQVICLMVLDICVGLQYLHEQKIVHRDIKLQNVMLSSKGTIKIIDLGQSNNFGQDIIRKTVRGTKTYFSPQIINHDQQNDKTDVWCLGIIIYELICLQSPFWNSNQKQMYQNIRVYMLYLQICRDFGIPFHKKQRIKNNYQIYLIKYLHGRYRELVQSMQSTIHGQKVISLQYLIEYTKKQQKTKNIPKFQHLFKQNQINQYKQFLKQEIQKYRNRVMKIKQQNKQIEKMIQKFKQGADKY